MTGYGFVPSTELSRLIGCEHVYRPDQGGHAPVRDENLLTSQPGIYIAGDAGGISGAAAARIEGRLAGLGVCRQLGRRARQRRPLSPHPIAIRRERRFAQSLAALFTPGDGLDALADRRHAALSLRERDFRRGEEDVARRCADGQRSQGSDLRRNGQLPGSHLRNAVAAVGRPRACEPRLSSPGRIGLAERCDRRFILCRSRCWPV